MRRQRATRTDNLLSVIEVIELGRRSGLLTIEREGQRQNEEGDIYFLHGEAIYASTSLESGRAALNAMRSWGACWFAFLADVPQPKPNIGPELRGARPPTAGGGHPQNTGPLAVPQHPSNPLSGQPRTPSPPSFNFSQRPRRRVHPQEIARVVATYQLSWGHRIVLLLADGDQSVSDLAHLTRRSEEEVARLLADLIQLGLVFWV